MSNAEQKQDQKEPEVETIAGPKGALTIGAKLLIKRLFGESEEKLKGLFTEYTKEVAESHEKFRKATLDAMDDSLKKLNVRFSGMYSQLINQFLVKQEVKVANCEVGVRAVIEVAADEIADLKIRNRELDASLLTLKNELAVVREAVSLGANNFKEFEIVAVDLGPDPIKEAFRKAVEDKTEVIAKELVAQAREQAVAAQKAQEEAALKRTETKETPNGAAVETTGQEAQGQAGSGN